MDHPDAFKDTLKGEIEEGLRLTGRQGTGAHRDSFMQQLWRELSGVSRKIRIFHSAHHAVAAFRRGHALPSHGNCGRENSTVKSTG